MNRKRVLTLLVLVLLALTLALSPAFAAGEEQPAKDEGGTFEKIVAALLDFPIRMAERLGIFKPIPDLIFGHEVWTDQEAKFIRAWYAALSAVCLPFLLFAIALTGFKLVAAGVNPAMRTEAIESIWRWFGALALIIFAPILTDLLISACNILADGVKRAYELAGGAGNWNADAFRGGQINVVTGSVLGTVLVKLFFLFLWVWFNLVYLVRKYVLTAILCFTPLMAVLWAINRNVPAFAIWLGELGSNALMPVAHALVLCVFLSLVDMTRLENGNWVFVLVGMYMVIPLAEMIRNSVQALFIRWAGVDEAGTAFWLTATMMGGAGILSLFRLAGTLRGPQAPLLPGPGEPAPGNLGNPTPSNIMWPPGIPGGTSGSLAIWSPEQGQAGPGFAWWTPAALAVLEPGAGRGAGNIAFGPAWDITFGSGGSATGNPGPAGPSGGPGRGAGFSGAGPGPGGGPSGGANTPPPGKPGTDWQAFGLKAADKGTHIAAGVAGWAAGAMTRLASGAVPGMSLAGERIARKAESLADGSVRLGAAGAAVGAKVRKEGWGYLGGDWREALGNVARAGYHAAKGHLPPSVLVQAQSLGDAVQKAREIAAARPRYRGGGRAFGI